jgi:cysteine desulfurase/selenocysteine lyase
MNIQQIKKDFPIFQKNSDLIYLDSTATSLKPLSVINKLNEYYQEYSANIYRGVYKISEKATKEYEDTRGVVAKFINASSVNEVVFTSGTTESINLVAYCLGRQIIEKGDEIVTTIMEHHSNFVPWQQLALETGADFKVVNVDDDGYLAFVKNGEVDVTELSNAVTKKTKIFAVTYISNVLGTINPLKKIITAAKKINPKVIVVIDAAQAVPHHTVDVQDLGCDFLAFSGHKMLGPTGVGVLWGKYELLEQMYPFKYGGEMIDEVFVDHTDFKKPPHKFEAGTPQIAEVIALKEAVKYLQTLNLHEVRQHEKELCEYLVKSVKDNFGEKIRVMGPENCNDRGGIIAFTFSKYHPHDVAQILDENNIAVRAGHHCAMPLHTVMNINASVRVSFYMYNEKSDIDKLVEGLHKVEKTLG